MRRFKFMNIMLMWTELIVNLVILLSFARLAKLAFPISEIAALCDGVIVLAAFLTFIKYGVGLKKVKKTVRKILYLTIFYVALLGEVLLNGSVNHDIGFVFIIIVFSTMLKLDIRDDQVIFLNYKDKFKELFRIN